MPVTSPVDYQIPNSPIYALPEGTYEEVSRIYAILRSITSGEQSAINLIANTGIIGQDANTGSLYAIGGSPDLTVPPTPAGFVVTSGLTSNYLSWTAMGANYLQTEVWFATTNSLAAATYLDSSSSTAFQHAVGLTNTTYYYWIRFMSKAFVVGPYNAGEAGGTGATTSKVGGVDLYDLIITSQKLASGAVLLDKFGTGLKPIIVVAALPALPHADYPLGAVVFLTGDTTLYRSTGTAWVKSVAATDISGTITSTQITDGAISTPKLAANAVTAAKIAAGTITANELAANSVISSKILAGEINAGHIAASSISATHMQANSITAGNGAIANLAVINAKIADLAVDKLTGGTIGAQEIYVGGGGLMLSGSLQRLIVSDGTTNRLEAGSLGAGAFGLILRDSAGGVFLNSGGITAAPWTAVTARPANLAALAGTEGIQNSGIGINANGTLSGAGAGAVSLGGLGAGAFATLTQLTSGNIGTYIAAAAISDAYIGNLSANKITAGTITGSTLRTAASGQRFEVSTASGYGEFYDSGGTLRTRIGFTESGGVQTLIYASAPTGYRGAFIAADNHVAITGHSASQTGVWGGTNSIEGGSYIAGVVGASTSGTAMIAASTTGPAFKASSSDGIAVDASSATNIPIRCNFNLTRGSFHMDTYTGSPATKPSSPQEGDMYILSNPAGGPPTEPTTDNGLVVYSRNTSGALGWNFVKFTAGGNV